MSNNQTSLVDGVCDNGGLSAFGERRTSHEVGLDLRLSLFVPITQFIIKDVLEDHRVRWDKRFAESIAYNFHDNFVLFVDGLADEIVASPITDYKHLLNVFKERQSLASRLISGQARTIVERRIVEINECLPDIMSRVPVVSQYKACLSSTIGRLNALYGLLPDLFDKSVDLMNDVDFVELSPLCMAIAKDCVVSRQTQVGNDERSLSFAAIARQELKLSLAARVSLIRGEFFNDAFSQIDAIISGKWENSVSH